MIALQDKRTNPFLLHVRPRAAHSQIQIQTGEPLMWIHCLLLATACTTTLSQEPTGL
ncbi:hypothetical protein JZ751_017494 [Albula glossodonta]|uniref:Uncharacterized protein n=1 Tax=Albula glossodonta TaxID=121402 RepID=A0A8T2PNV4_9TELE|nr:hypothetical protein JZ751_017494 [Albula glossodonta]